MSSVERAIQKAESLSRGFTGLVYAVRTPLGAYAVRASELAGGDLATVTIIGAFKAGREVEYCPADVEAVA